MVHLIHTVEHVQNNLLLPFGGAGQEEFSRTDGQMRVDECYCCDPISQRECGQPFNQILREYREVQSASDTWSLSSAARKAEFKPLQIIVRVNPGEIPPPRSASK